MAYIKTDESGRITSANYSLPFEGAIEVEIPALIKKGTLHNYKYIDGEFMHDPLEEEEVPTLASEVEKIKADLAFLAMMTNVDMEV